MAELGIDGHKSNRSLGPLWRVNRKKLREVKPKVEEPIGYELTIQDTNEVEWEHYTSMREYSGLTLKDGKYNLEDVMKSMMDAYETRI